MTLAAAVWLLAAALALGCPFQPLWTFKTAPQLPLLCCCGVQAATHAAAAYASLDCAAGGDLLLACRLLHCAALPLQSTPTCRMQVVWANFTALPPASGLPASDTAGMWGVTATPTAAVYAQGARLYGLSPDDGRQLWQIVVSAGAGTGLNPNVTSVAYVPVLDAVPSRQYPMLLMTSSTWDQTRFMAYQLNGSSATAAPTVAWQVRRRGGLHDCWPSAELAAAAPAEVIELRLRLLVPAGGCLA